MNIAIFDTETTSLDKPFCYNIGYLIVDTENHDILVKRDYVVEQVWHNPMLFITAYYADKRDIYIKRMRAKTVKMEKYGYICQQMIRDFKQFDVAGAYAYNSGFDERVFNFNCDWFKCNNPFDNVPIFDIRGYAHQFIVNDDFKRFCDTYEYYTDNGNYSTTAETLYRFITNNIDFEEEHTALCDSIIETEILLDSISQGAEYNTNYTVLKSIPRRVKKTLTVKDAEKNIVAEFECYGYTVYKSRNNIQLK